MGLAALAAGCSAPPAPPRVKPIAPVIAEALPTLPPGQTPDKQRRFKEPSVYLDGRPVAVMRSLELPPSLPMRPVKLVDGRVVARWRLAEYLEALGAKLADVKEIHLYGGRDRVSVVSGDMVRKFKEKLLFSFTQGTRGKARVHYPTVPGFDTNTTVDTIALMTVYLEKTPPKFDPRKQTFSLDDGVPIEGIPYAPRESDIRGTRFYQDGKLVSAMKRKTLPDALLAEGSTVREPTFSLRKYLESGGVAASFAGTVDFLVGDDLVARADAAQWKSHGGEIAFSIPRRSQGKVMMSFPEGAATIAEKSAARRAKVSAVELFAPGTAPKRELTPISERDAADEGGSRDHQPDPQNPEE